MLKFLFISSQRGKSKPRALPFLLTPLRVQGQSPDGCARNEMEFSLVCVFPSQFTTTPYISSETGDLLSHLLLLMLPGISLPHLPLCVSTITYPELSAEA